MTRPLKRQPLPADNTDQLLPIDAACAQAAAFARVIEGTEAIALSQAFGRSAAQDVVAVRAHPPCDQSAMDGYALAASCGTTVGTRLRVEGKITAGDEPGNIAPATTTRIFTGAPVPLGTSTVVMQEHVARDGAFIVLQRSLAAGDNIRRRAEDVAPGDLLVAAGERLDARRIAIIAAQGIDRVVVRRPVRVAVVSTGNELHRSADALCSSAGIFDSNRPMLLALAAGRGHEAIDAGTVPDDPTILADLLRRLSATCDLIVTTGGASVGEKDHAAAALALAGGAGITLKMALKPGKPAVVGAIGAAAYLGLPGNPLAALVSWSLLGSAMLARLEGRDRARPRGFPVPITSSLARKPGRIEFVPARLVERPGGTWLELLSGNAALLRPLVEADGFAELPDTLAAAERGSRLAFHPFERMFAI